MVLLHLGEEDSTVTVCHIVPLTMVSSLARGTISIATGGMGIAIYNQQRLFGTNTVAYAEL